MADKLHVMHEGSWVEADDLSVRDGSEWKRVREVWVRRLKPGGDPEVGELEWVLAAYMPASTPTDSPAAAPSLSHAGSPYTLRVQLDLTEAATRNQRWQLYYASDDSFTGYFGSVLAGQSHTQDISFEFDTWMHDVDVYAKAAFFTDPAYVGPYTAASNTETIQEFDPA